MAELFLIHEIKWCMVHDAVNLSNQPAPKEIEREDIDAFVTWYKPRFDHWNDGFISLLHEGLV
jgi:hypothetical protein